jgi:hypothetical protein
MSPALAAEGWFFCLRGFFRKLFRPGDTGLTSKRALAPEVSVRPSFEKATASRLADEAGGFEGPQLETPTEKTRRL